MSVELGANSIALLQLADSSPGEAARRIMALEVPCPAEVGHPDPGYGCVDWYQYDIGVQTEAAAEL